MFPLNNLARKELMWFHAIAQYWHAINLNQNVKKSIKDIGTGQQTKKYVKQYVTSSSCDKFKDYNLKSSIWNTLDNYQLLCTAAMHDFNKTKYWIKKGTVLKLISEITLININFNTNMGK